MQTQLQLFRIILLNYHVIQDGRRNGATTVLNLPNIHQVKGIKLFLPFPLPAAHDLPI